MKNKPNITLSLKEEENILLYLKREVQRYKQKGYGFFVACAQVAVFVYYVPNLARYFWPKFLALGIPEIYLEPLSLFVLTLFANALANLYFAVIYLLEWDFFERYKSNLMPWPWQKDRRAWHEFLKKTLKLIIFNKFVFVPIGIFINGWYKDFECPFRTDVDSLPDSFTFVVTCLFCTFMEGIAFSISHHTLHLKFLYPKIHKIHHEYVATVSISSEYAHPIEYLFGNILPTALSPALLGQHVHLFTVILFYMLRVIGSIEGHSGYNFSWSPLSLIPFWAEAEYHDFHHSHNCGNYSGFVAYDSFFGTNAEYYQYKKMKDDALKKIQNGENLRVRDLNAKLLLYLREEERKTRLIK